MSWIQENKVPAAILGLTGAGVVGLGVMLYMAWDKASLAQETFNTTNDSMAALKGAALAPTAENLKTKGDLVTEYHTEVGRLATVLHALEPQNAVVTNTEFQAKLKTKITDIRRAGGARLPGEFSLTFDKYASELPKSNEVATELSGYLDSVDSIVRLLLDSGVASIVQVTRTDLPSEGGAAVKPQAANTKKKGPGGQQAAETSQFTTRRTVTVTINTDQGPLQTLLSRLASPSEMPYFTVVRLVRIENVQKAGPARVAAAAAPGASIDPDAPPPVASADAAPPAGTPAGAAPAAAAPAATVATQPATPDSYVVLGKEMLVVYLEIDLVNFLGAQQAASTNAPPGAGAAR